MACYPEAIIPISSAFLSGHLYTNQKPFIKLIELLTTNMGNRTKKAMKKAQEAEEQKMKDQQDGIFEKCHRPTLTGVLNGEVGDCKITPFTQRRCPPCSAHRKAVAFSLAGKQKAAKAQIELNIIKLNARQLLDDKENLLQKNSSLTEEIGQLKIAYHESIQRNFTISKELEEWKLSHNQLQVGIQTLQNNILQLETIIKDLQNGNANIPYSPSHQNGKANISYTSPHQVKEADPANVQMAFQGAQIQQQQSHQYQPQLQQQLHLLQPPPQQQQQHLFQLP